jgi:hypothetical protein
MNILEQLLKLRANGLERNIKKKDKSSEKKKDKLRTLSRLRLL